jgi:hypothetical protein
MMTSGKNGKTGLRGADKDREVYWRGRAQAIRMATEVPVLLGKTPPGRKAFFLFPLA